MNCLGGGDFHCWPRAGRDRANLLEIFRLQLGQKPTIFSCDLSKARNLFPTPCGCPLAALVGEPPFDAPATSPRRSKQAWPCGERHLPRAVGRRANRLAATAATFWPEIGRCRKRRARPGRPAPSSWVTSTGRPGFLPAALSPGRDIPRTNSCSSTGPGRVPLQGPGVRWCRVPGARAASIDQGRPRSPKRSGAAGAGLPSAAGRRWQRCCRAAIQVQGPRPRGSWDHTLQPAGSAVASSLASARSAFRFGPSRSPQRQRIAWVWGGSDV